MVLPLDEQVSFSINVLIAHKKTTFVVHVVNLENSRRSRDLYTMFFDVLFHCWFVTVSCTCETVQARTIPLNKLRMASTVWK